MRVCKLSERAVFIFFFVSRVCVCVCVCVCVMRMYPCSYKVLIVTEENFFDKVSHDVGQMG